MRKGKNNINVRSPPPVASLSIRISSQCIFFPNQISFIQISCFGTNRQEMMKTLLWRSKANLLFYQIPQVQSKLQMCGPMLKNQIKGLYIHETNMSCFIQAEILNQHLILIIVNPYSSHKETKTYFIRKTMHMHRSPTFSKKILECIITFEMFEMILELFKHFNGRTAKYTMNINKWQNKIIL